MCIRDSNYSAWLEQKAKRMKQEERESESRKRAIDLELEWVRQSPKARQAKSKARLAAYEDLVNQAEREKQTFAQIQIPPGPRLGTKAVSYTHLDVYKRQLPRSDLPTLCLCSA